MSAPFSQSPIADRGRQIWAPRAGEAGVVAFLSDRNHIWKAALHWLPDSGRSALCSGGDCPLCDKLPFVEKAYAPVVLYRGYLTKTEHAWKVPQLQTTFDPRLWSERTLEITSSNSWLWDKSARGAMYLFTRPGKGKNNKPKAEPLGQVLNLPSSMPPFDVRPCCMRAWGITRALFTGGKRRTEIPTERSLSPLS